MKQDDELWKDPVTQSSKAVVLLLTNKGVKFYVNFISAQTFLGAHTYQLCHNIALKIIN